VQSLATSPAASSYEGASLTSECYWSSFDIGAFDLTGDSAGLQLDARAPFVSLQSFVCQPADLTICLATLPTVETSSSKAISFNGTPIKYLAAQSNRRVSGVLSPRLLRLLGLDLWFPEPRVCFPRAIGSSTPL
jgi:hypothetical protein